MPSPDTNASKPAAARKSPFAHRAASPPGPPAAVPDSATPARVSPGRSKLVVPAIVGGALALGGAAVWAARDDGRGHAAPAPVARSVPPKESLRAAQAESSAMSALAKRCGADRAGGEDFARGLARLSEADSLARAGKDAEAAAAHAAASERFARAVLRTCRADLARALSAIRLKDVREYRADLWGALDRMVAEADADERAGRLAAAARRLDAAASSVAGCLDAAREELAKLAVETEAAGNLDAARLLRFKLAKVAPEDAGNLAWLMRRGRAAGAVVRDPLGIPFAYVAPGAYSQGSPPSEAGRKPDETPRRVSVSRGFFLAVTEVTQAQWDSVLGAGASAARLNREPAAFSRPDLPVVNLTWDEAREFCQKLSARTGLRYRLPTEAEWEYACRAGADSPYSGGKLFLSCSDAAVDDGTAGAPTAPRPVASSGAANAWGLRDMHGNVWEWCSDWYGVRAPGDVINPAGPADKDAGRADIATKVVRGGSWTDSAAAARSANRWSYPPGVRVNYIGLRPLLEFNVEVE